MEPNPAENYKTHMSLSLNKTTEGSFVLCCPITLVIHNFKRMTKHIFLYNIFHMSTLSFKTTVMLILAAFLLHTAVHLRKVYTAKHQQLKGVSN